MSGNEPSWDKYPRKFGKYHLLGPLAQGGMGALYLAVTGDRGLERLLVIKTVLPHLADAEYIARFRDEAKVVVKLSHGNLIPVFDAGQVGGELFLAMDFVEGRDLRALWNRCAKKQVAFPIDIAVYIVKELCRGLAYAHSFPDLELVHRDVSPPNILISYTGEVKLTDFGLASSTLKLEKTAPGIIYGKVAYMSPEQARGEKLEGRSDQYASGIVLWELLTGRQLFPPGKEQPQDLLSRARNPEVLRPSRRAPRVPPELDDICVRALSADKDQRYGNCDEMQKALQTWLAANAPTTDSTRMSSFIQELFVEDISRDRAERDGMMSNLRKRAMTLPPTDELRQIVEKSAQFQVREPGAMTPAVRTPGSVGRRSTDRGENGNDRRQSHDRRHGYGSHGQTQGRAVEVPPPASDGRTVPPPISSRRSSSELAAAQQLAPAQDFDADDSASFVGQVIDGRYRISELIGEGGMGKVYLAEHVEIGKRVAIKVLHPTYSRMPDLVERFRREARAASKIGHPHIVDVTDSGTTRDGSVYFVMEYLEGVELGSVIEREGALEVARALRIATMICRALSAAHAAGIIHRDLKPENVFLTIREGSADFAKVLDFGIAKTTEAEEARDRRLTSPGMAMGTPEYMAPEQAAGRAADERCDVYALGAILYEMLTGVPPYQGDNFMEILTKKATLDPVPPMQLRSSIPDAVSELVMRAMARNPDDRPPSMEAFEYEILKCLAGRGAAVAQILGMTTDANLVAHLNPGISVRHFEGGVMTRAATSPAAAVSAMLAPPMVVTPSSGNLAAPAASALRAVNRLGSPRPGGLERGGIDGVSPPNGIASGGDFSATAVVDSIPVGQVVTVRGSRAAMVGWLVLAALLFGGVGVVLYVAAGERAGKQAREQAALAAAAATKAADGELVEPAVAADRAAATPRPDGDGKDRRDGDAPPKADAKPEKADAKPEKADAKPDTRSEKADAKPEKADPKPDKADGRRADARKKGDGPPTSEKEAKQLLAEAKNQVARMDYPGARDTYARIADSKFFRGQGLLGMAKVAWETRDVDGAITLAQQALKAGAGDPARTLLGHAYFKKNDYARALQYYEAVLANRPNDPEVKRSVEALRARMGGM
jgi:serine/threonine protein kinase